MNAYEQQSRLDHVINRSGNRDRIVVLPPEVSGGRVLYHFSVTDNLKKCFHTLDGFAAEWPFEAEGIPESVLILPLLAQLLPVAWITDAEISVSSCDREFLESAESLRAGYRKMYPGFPFRGVFRAETAESVPPPAGASGDAAVCAVCAGDSLKELLSASDKKPLAYLLWGADISWGNDTAWRERETELRREAEALGLRALTVRSSFRSLLRESRLTGRLPAAMKGWLDEYQRTFGVLFHMAPAAWRAGAEKVLIPRLTLPEGADSGAAETAASSVRFCGSRAVPAFCEFRAPRPVRTEKRSRSPKSARKAAVRSAAFGFSSAWRVHGILRGGWRRDYALYAAGYAKGGANWKQSCRTVCRTLKNTFPEKCSPFFLARSCLDFLFCSSLVGANSGSDYVGNELFRNGWGFRRKVMTGGKRRFASLALNSEDAWTLCNSKPASAEWWREWFGRGWLTVGPGNPVTPDMLRTLLNGKDRVILKPTNKSCGKGIRVLNLSGETEIQETAAMLNRLETPHILEEYIAQTGLFHEISPSSVNTIRVVTVKHRDGSIGVENVFARFGHEGAMIDNVSSGGCEFWVDHRTGVIGPGKGRNGSCYTVHPETGHPITGLRIPRYDEAVELCESAHRHAPEGLRLAGWDVCISDDRLCLIEVNATPGFSSAPDGNFDHWGAISRLLDEYSRPEESAVRARRRRLSPVFSIWSLLKG